MTGEDDEMPVVAQMGTGTYQAFRADRLPGGMAGDDAAELGATWVCCEIFDSGKPLVIGYLVSSAVAFPPWKCLTAAGGPADGFGLSPFIGLLMLATRQELEKEKHRPESGRRGPAARPRRGQNPGPRHPR